MFSVTAPGFELKSEFRILQVSGSSTGSRLCAERTDMLGLELILRSNGVTGDVEAEEEDDERCHWSLLIELMEGILGAESGRDK